MKQIKFGYSCVERSHVQIPTVPCYTSEQRKLTYSLHAIRAHTGCPQIRRTKSKVFVIQPNRFMHSYEARV